MPHRLLPGVTSCSGKTVIHTHTPVPVRIGGPPRHIWKRAPHFRHLSVQWAAAQPHRPLQAPHTHTHALRRWLSVPSAPAPPITNTPSNELWHYSERVQNTSTRVQHFYFLSYLQFGSAQKYSVQILLQSVISGLTLVTPIITNLYEQKG